MLLRFIDNCVKNKIFESQNNLGVVIAVSGGADSLALMDLLQKSQRRFKLKLCVAHFDHGLRGNESIADAEFVKKITSDRGIDCIIESGDVRSFAESQKLSIETAARELRHKFLERVRQSLNFDLIALAHHADDQAETILMRIIRGAGSIGLSAMKVKSDRLIRPLLNFRKSELENYCAKVGLIPRIDSTNFETDATRNKIRLELLPLLKNYNPAIVESLCKLGATTAEDTNFIQSEALKIFPTAIRFNDQIELSKAVIKNQHITIQRALIRLFVEKSIGSVKDFEFVHIESIRRVMTDNLKGVELPHKFRADLKKDWLSIKKK
ncbi:MAG: tRNA lysidine(34) synthetase TilS [Selenomonadaceae bacterium]|nr:tRNA lysidine(34) synthetase TilS [Selenomonadaceae bacterium]